MIRRTQGFGCQFVKARTHAGMRPAEIVRNRPFFGAALAFLAPIIDTLGIAGTGALAGGAIGGTYGVLSGDRNVLGDVGLGALAGGAAGGAADALGLVGAGSGAGSGIGLTDAVSTTTDAGGAGVIGGTGSGAGGPIALSPGVSSVGEGATAQAANGLAVGGGGASAGPSAISAAAPASLAGGQDLTATLGLPTGEVPTALSSTVSSTTPGVGGGFGGGGFGGGTAAGAGSGAGAGAGVGASPAATAASGLNAYGPLGSAGAGAGPASAVPPIVPDTPAGNPLSDAWNAISGITGSGTGKTLGTIATSLGLAKDLTAGNHVQGLGNIQQLAQSSATQGATLQNYLTTGTLPPAVQASIDAATKDGITAIKSRYASMGVAPGGSAEAADIARLKQNAIVQGATLADQLLQSGIHESELSGQLYNDLVKYNLSQNQQTGQAIGNLAYSLAGGPVRNNNNQSGGNT